MVGFSVIFPLFPEMLDHYLERESLLGGGILTDFVISIQGLAFEGAVQNKSFRFETVIFGGVLGLSLCHTPVLFCSYLGAIV